MYLIFISNLLRTTKNPVCDYMTGFFVVWVPGISKNSLKLLWRCCQEIQVWQNMGRKTVRPV